MKNHFTADVARGWNGLKIISVLPNSLTLWTAQSGVTNARVLVVSKVEKGAAVVSVQKDALVDHPFNNICSQAQTEGIISLEAYEQCLLARRSTQVPKHPTNQMIQAALIVNKS